VPPPHRRLSQSFFSYPLLVWSRRHPSQLRIFVIVVIYADCRVCPFLVSASFFELNGCDVVPFSPPNSFLRPISPIARDGFLIPKANCSPMDHPLPVFSLPSRRIPPKSIVFAYYRAVVFTHSHCVSLWRTPPPGRRRLSSADPTSCRRCFTHGLPPLFPVHGSWMVIPCCFSFSFSPL